MYEEASRIAAIVPCHNEEITVAKVVGDLKAAVPGITVYVYDNCSSDRTSQRAAEAGAIVRKENVPGKGNVVRRAFADIDADIYVMIDGDDTYEAAHLPEMIDTLISGPCDHVLGVRQDNQETTSYRPGHEAGNKMFNRLTGWLFGSEVSDMLSGYRVFSRRFVKSFPAISRRFEIETELTVHTMSLRLPTTEVAVDFRDRPDGSESKLSTFKDGFRILGLISAPRPARTTPPVLRHAHRCCLPPCRWSSDCLWCGSSGRPDSCPGSRPRSSPLHSWDWRSCSAASA